MAKKKNQTSGSDSESTNASESVRLATRALVEATSALSDALKQQAERATENSANAGVRIRNRVAESLREAANSVEDSVSAATRSKRVTRDDLLASAAQLFALKGFDGASIDDIAQDAGYSKGAVYSNFGSKDALFLALIDQRLANGVRVPQQVRSVHRNDAVEWIVDTITDSNEDRDQPPLDELLDLEMVSYALRRSGARDALARQYDRMIREWASVLHGKSDADSLDTEEIRSGILLTSIVIVTSVMRELGVESVDREQIEALIAGVVPEQLPDEADQLDAFVAGVVPEELPGQLEALIADVLPKESQ